MSGGQRPFSGWQQQAAAAGGNSGWQQSVATVGCNNRWQQQLAAVGLVVLPRWSARCSRQRERVGYLFGAAWTAGRRNARGHAARNGGWRCSGCRLTPQRSDMEPVRWCQAAPDKAAAAAVSLLAELAAPLRGRRGPAPLLHLLPRSLPPPPPPSRSAPFISPCVGHAGTKEMANPVQSALVSSRWCRIRERWRWACQHW